MIGRMDSPIMRNRYQNLLRIQFGTLVTVNQDHRHSILSITYPKDDDNVAAGDQEAGEPVFYFRVRPIHL